MENKPLYESEKLKVDTHPNSTEDHILYVKAKSGEGAEYFIFRGILRELAEGDMPNLVDRLYDLNPNIIFKLKTEGIKMNELHTALKQAYAEEERLVEAYAEQN